MYDIHLYNNTYSHDQPKSLIFNPFAILYRENKSIYIQVINNSAQDKITNMPALLYFNSLRIEVFSIMRQFIELLKMQNYDMNQIYDEINSHLVLNSLIQHKESEYRTLNLYNQDKFTQFYKIITLDNQQPILVLDKNLQVEENKPYYLIPSSEYHKWINAFIIKPTFPLLCFGSQTSICRWTPKNHIQYPIEFRNKVYMVMKGVFLNQDNNLCWLRLINNDLLVKIIEHIVESTYDCPYYHVFKKTPLITPIMQ
jgi:hypothetical protein